VHPAGKADGFAHVGSVEFGTGVAAIDVHGSRPFEGKFQVRADTPV
jgi:hypothetical protein